MTDDGTEPTDLALGEVLAAAAEDVADVATTVVDDATRWELDGTVFAVLEGGRAEFRLDPVIAAAALRTADTAPSTRGPEWVAFSPSVLDVPAVDRAEAWFHSASRRAAARRG